MPQAALLTLSFLGLSLDSIAGVLAVVLGFGMLIFVHELGHFLVAKWAGVRVEVFSLGFGPRLFGFERSGTDYRVSALPLGGYVKMLGQDDSDPTTARTAEPDDFRNKSIGARMAILVAGVVMNTIFAVIAFIVAFAVGVEFIAPEVGYVTPNLAGSSARLVSGPPGTAQGLQPGDYVLRINGSDIIAYEDIQTTVALSSGRLVLDVARPGSGGVVHAVTLEASPRRESTDSYPRLGIDATTIVSEFDPDSPLPAAGLRPGDEIVEVAPVGSTLTGQRMDWGQIVAGIRGSPERPLQVVVERRRFDPDGRPLEGPAERPTFVATPLGRPVYDVGIDFADEAWVRRVLADSPAAEHLKVGDRILSIDGVPATETNLRELLKAAADRHAVAGASETSPIPLSFERLAAGKPAERHDVAVRLKRRDNDEGWKPLGIDYRSNRVRAVTPGSPAAEVGIEAGDFVTTIWTETFLGIKYRGAQPADRFAVAEATRAKKDEPWKIAWEKPDGSEKTAEIAARKTDEKWGDLAFTAGPRLIKVRRAPVAACALGVQRTGRMFQQLVQTLRGLFVRQVSTGELGGPIQIAAITYKVAERGVGKLLYFLAILSVNLAVLNILPIPVLDGGHIFLLMIEKLKGRPLSDEVMRYVQYAGLLFVVGLMAYVTFNDIRRVFE